MPPPSQASMEPGGVETERACSHSYVAGRRRQFVRGRRYLKGTVTTNQAMKRLPPVSTGFLPKGLTCHREPQTDVPRRPGPRDMPKLQSKQYSEKRKPPTWSTRMTVEEETSLEWDTLSESRPRWSCCLLGFVTPFGAPPGTHEMGGFIPQQAGWPRSHDLSVRVEQGLIPGLLAHGSMLFSSNLASHLLSAM